MTGKVMTVRGPIDPGNLGITLMHEHHFIETVTTILHAPDGNTPVSEAIDWYDPLTIQNLHTARGRRTSIKDNGFLDDEKLAAEEVSEFRDRGGSTIVDMSNIGIRRDPQALMRVSNSTGLNIVMGSSWYVKNTHPDNMDTLSVDDLTAEIVRDITVGVGDTGIRSGIIGEVGINGDPLTPNEIKVVRASARASRATGAAISFHSGGLLREKLEVARIVSEEGGDLTRTIFGHSDVIANNMPLMLELLETGVYVQFDLLGRVVTALSLGPSDPRNPWEDYLSIAGAVLVADAIMKLIDAGYLDRILISQDIATKVQLKRYGGTGYSFILESFLPHLRRIGISDEHINQIMVESPKRVLTLESRK